MYSFSHAVCKLCAVCLSQQRSDGVKASLGTRHRSWDLHSRLRAIVMTSARLLTACDANRQYNHDYALTIRRDSCRGAEASIMHRTSAFRQYNHDHSPHCQ